MISVHSKSSAGNKPLTKVGGVGSLAIWLNGRHPNQFLYTDERGDRIPLDDIEDAMGYSAGSVRWERASRRGAAIAESVVAKLGCLHETIDAEVSVCEMLAFIKSHAESIPSGDWEADLGFDDDNKLGRELERELKIAFGDRDFSDRAWRLIDKTWPRAAWHLTGEYGD